MGGNAVRGNKENAEKSELDEPTTIRAAVTKAEHAVVKRVAKQMLGQNIEEFVRMAVGREIQSCAGKSWDTLADEEKTRGRFIQGELF